MSMHYLCLGAEIRKIRGGGGVTQSSIHGLVNMLKGIESIIYTMKIQLRPFTKS